MNTSFNVEGKVFSAKTEASIEKLSIRKISEKDGVEIYEFDCSLQDVSPLSLEWEEEMQGICSVWAPTAKRDRSVRQWFNPIVNFSDIYDGAPILSVLQDGGENFATVAFSDAEIPVKLLFYVKDFDQKDKVGFKIVLFENDKREVREFKAQIRLDKRKIPYYQSIADVTSWWKEFYPSNGFVPKDCETPLYSTWYNFHQSPTQRALEDELVLASEMGFKTVILDDGWQIDGVGTGDYAFCGDWSVAKSKFPDFKGFAQKVHSLGMKLIVWFPVPFVGYETEDYRKFAGMYLYQHEEFRARVLDPRYPKVRNYLVDTYVSMSKKYDLDGLKLDFIDSFMIKDETPAYGEGMDCKTLEESIVKLLEEIDGALKALREDFMIEFRQNYVGPSIVRYCNMLRVADCAFDPLTNRIGICDLKMPRYDVAVHSDMLLWEKDETPENCALQLLNVLFSVPQISVLLKRSTEKQRKAIKSFIAYWTANKDVLLHGEFATENVQYNYPFLSSQKGDKKIAVAYLPMSSVYLGEEMDIFNATKQNGLCIQNPNEYCVEVKIYDCFGEVISEKTLCDKLLWLEIPIAGRAEIKKA